MASQDSKRFPFTPYKLNSLKPADKVVDYRDLGSPGLTLRVTTKGKKVFRWTFRDVAGKHRVKTLGTYPNLSLADARKQLETEKAHHRQNLETGEVEFTEVTNIAELCQIFYEYRLKSSRRTADETKRRLDVDIVKSLGRVKLDPVPSTKLISQALMKVSNRAPVHSGQLLTLVKQLFNFAASNGYVRYNPAAPIRPEDIGARDYTRGTRSLSGDEIHTFWHAVDASGMENQTKIGLKLLLLTAVRSGELLKAEWSQINFDAKTWTIPTKNQKLSPKQERNASDFVIPMAPQVIALFRQLHEITGHSEWVMAYRKTHYSRKAFTNALDRLFKHGIGIPRCTPHDLRRTARTQLGETLRIEPHIAERCLNHSLGALSATYDRGTYFEARRSAMEKLADQVDLYVLRPDNVTLIGEVGNG